MFQMFVQSRAGSAKKMAERSSSEENETGIRSVASSETLTDGSPVAPWLTPAYLQGDIDRKKRSPSNQTDSRADDQSSRLTIEAETDFPQLVLGDDDPDSEKTSVLETDDVKGRRLPPIEGITGERERLMSRTSTKLAKLPRIRTSSQLSQRPSGDDLHGDVATPWYKKVDQSKTKNLRAKSSASYVQGEAEEEVFDEPTKVLEPVKPAKEGHVDEPVLPKAHDETNALSKGKMVSKKVIEPVKPLTNFLFQPFSNEKKKEVNKQAERAAKFMKKGKNQKFKTEQKKIYAAYKKNKVAEQVRKASIQAPIEEVKFKVTRRTSSAKVPKEIQERLNNEMGRLRRVRSSFAMADELGSPDISDAESVESIDLGDDIGDDADEGHKGHITDVAVKESEVGKEVETEHDGRPDVDKVSPKLTEPDDKDAVKIEPNLNNEQGKNVDQVGEHVKTGESSEPEKIVEQDRQLVETEEANVTEKSGSRNEKHDMENKDTIEHDVKFITDLIIEKVVEGDEEVLAVTEQSTKSRTEVLPSQQSRNAVQQSRLTIQSLQSVSIAMESDDDDIEDVVTMDLALDNRIEESGQQKSDVGKRNARLIMIDERPVHGMKEGRKKYNSLKELL